MTGLLRIGKVLQVNLQEKQTMQMDKHITKLSLQNSSNLAKPWKFSSSNYFHTGQYVVLLHLQTHLSIRVLLCQFTDQHCPCVQC